VRGILCGLKAYTFGVRKINLSGISPANYSRPGPNSVYVDRSRGANVQGILGAIGPFGQNWGWDDILVESRDFLIHSLLQDNPLRKTIANIFAIFSTTDYHVV